MELNYDALRFWFDVAQFLGLIALAVFTFVTRKSSQNTDLIAAITKQLQEMDREVLTLRHKVEAGPTHEDLQRVHDRISEVKNQGVATAVAISGQTADIKSLTAAVGLLTRKQMGDSNG